MYIDRYVYVYIYYNILIYYDIQVHGDEHKRHRQPDALEHEPARADLPFGPLDAPQR